MRDVYEEMEPHRPVTVETEAEADNVFILEELITKLTARDPLANRLAQLNEYIESMQKQPMMEETAPDRIYENAYTQLKEVETEFSKVMRAEDYWEQKLRLQCAQPHGRSPSTPEPTNAENEIDTKENTEAATAIDDDKSIQNEPTNHTAGTTKRKTAPITAPKRSLASRAQQKKEDAQEGNKGTSPNRENNTKRLGETNKQASRERRRMQDKRDNPHSSLNRRAWKGKEIEDETREAQRRNDTN
jgi:hypothetical protein